MWYKLIETIKTVSNIYFLFRMIYIIFCMIINNSNVNFRKTLV